MPDTLDYFIGLPHADPRRSGDNYPPPLGGGRRIQFLVYEITTIPVLGTPTTAKVDLYSPDDETTIIDTDVDWVGNLAMFDDHIVGSRGTCLRIGSKAYAVLAPCDVTGGSGSATPVVISATAPPDTSSLWIDTSGL